MSELISVIVPVYNVEKYLQRCVDSILKQTISNYEIILVDDGATDTSGLICDEYAKKYPDTIRVYHKKNGGLSDARNYGIAHATGTLITFIDSDDYISRYYLQVLYSKLKEIGAQIACCDYLRTPENAARHVLGKCETAIYTGELIQKKYLEKELVSAGGKLYDKCLFIDLDFPVGKLNEDIYTVYKLFCKSQKVVYIDEKMYFYYKNLDSITTQKFKVKNLDLLDAWGNVVSDSKNYSEEIQNLADFRYKKAYFTLLGIVAYYGMEENAANIAIKNKLLMELRNSSKMLLMNSLFPVNRKVAMILMLTWFDGCCFIGRVLKNIR